MKLLLQFLFLQVFAHGNIFKLKSYSPDAAVADAATYDKRGSIFIPALEKRQLGFGINPFSFDRAEELKSSPREDQEKVQFSRLAHLMGHFTTIFC